MARTIKPKPKKKKSNYELLTEAIMNSKSPSVFYVNNLFCIKCAAVKRYMIRVGAVVFCERCFKKEFNTEDPITEQRELYIKWLRKYNNLP